VAKHLFLGFGGLVCVLKKLYFKKKPLRLQTKDPFKKLG
jgi:hypothetical protein